MSKPVESHSLATDDHPICPTIVIPDDPETEDLLAGSPHANVAKSIADLMRSAERSVSIGLEGSWGAGKTTVIKLLINELGGPESNQPERVFTVVPFDAWTHEGDPLRRAFLESLIQRLKEAGWIKEKQAQRRLDILGQRLEEKTIENSPVLTNWGRLIGVSLLLIPIGSALLTRSLRDIELKFDPSYPFAPGVLLSLALMTLPFWIALLAYGVKKDDTLWSALFSKSISSTETSTTTKTPDQTANEFAKGFNEVLKEALADDELRHVAVVVDNLDRVDAADALSIWSTLQTFVKQSHFDPRPWLNRFWIIVVYDREGIRKLWERQQADNSETSSAFLDKSFQVRFEVPPPVLSDWRNALFKFLRQAFPAKHHRREDHPIHNTLALHFAQQQRLPTIRELKLIVNQMGVVHRQWALAIKVNGGEEFPLGHLAYFVTLKRTGRKIIDELRAGTLPDEAFRDVLGEEIANTLASVVFNVEKERALEIILGKPIEDALIVGNSEALINLATTHDGFWDVLQTVVSPSWLGGVEIDGVRLTTAVQALAKSHLLDVEKTPLARKVLTTLLRAAPRVRYWPFFNRDKGESLLELCQWNREWSERGDGRIVDQLEAKLLRSVSSSLAWYDPNAQLQVVNVSDWLDGLTILTTALDNTNQSLVDLRRHLILPLRRRLQPDKDGRPAGLHPRELEVTLEALYLLAGQTNVVRSELEPLVKENFLLRHLRPGITAENAKAMAWCLFIQMLFTHETAAIVHDKSNTEPYTTFFNHLNQPNGDVVAAFVDLVVSPYELKRIFTFLESGIGTPFLGEYVRIAISAKKLDALTPAVLWEHWAQVRSVLDSELLVREMPSPGKVEVIGIVFTFRTFVSALLQRESAEDSSESLPAYLMARDFRFDMAELYAAILLIQFGNLDFWEWVYHSLERMAPTHPDLADTDRRIIGLRKVLEQVKDAMPRES